MVPRAALAPIVPLALLPTLLLAGCGGSNETARATDTTSAAGTPSSSPSTSTSTSPSTSPGTATSCSYPADGAGSAGVKVSAPPAKPAVSGTVPVTLHSSIGPIRLTLDAASAPCTVNSFVSLAKQGYFDKTGCHRLTIQGIYVLQCGDPSGTGSGGPGYSFADELAAAQALAPDQEASAQTGEDYRTYPAGTVAMANAGANTNGSQFFLVYADSPLPPAYTVFGQIDTAGTRLISMEAANGTDNGTADGHPKKPVDFTSVTVG